ncbi:MAG: helix-turn-helix domain-containing protein [Bacteroidales bacterium]|nr:helix-turn-helix domain-containing protein [Bacteroidales bacterium]
MNSGAEKLIEMRKARGFTQKDMADRLKLDVSGYSKRESGQTKIRIGQWVELAKMLNVPVDDIYEEDETQSWTFKDNATGNYGANTIYITVPEALMETQLKYMRKLEEEISELKQLLVKM